MFHPPVIIIIIIIIMAEMAVMLRVWQPQMRETYMVCNRPIQAKWVTNCLRLETAMAPTVNRGWHLFANGK